jgi:hypothetical protein
LTTWLITGAMPIINIKNIIEVLPITIEITKG